MSEVPILQPGAPGNPTRELDAETAVNIANSSYTIADVEFMKDMIIHHHQALLMSRMAIPSTNNQSILDLAGRIDVSQEDEISFMQSWLQEREEQVPDPTTEHLEHTHHTMIGMATTEQMVQLAFKGSECNWNKERMEKFIALEFGFVENDSKFLNESELLINQKFTHNNILVTRKTLHNWRKRVKLLWDCADTKGFEDVCWEDLEAMRKYGIRDDFVTKLYRIWNKILIEWAKCGLEPDKIQKPSYSLLFWGQFLLMYYPHLSIFDIAVIAEAYVQRMRLYEAFKEDNNYEPRYMREDIDNWLAYIFNVNDVFSSYWLICKYK